MFCFNYVLMIIKFLFGLRVQFLMHKSFSLFLELLSNLVTVKLYSRDYIPKNELNFLHVSFQFHENSTILSYESGQHLVWSFMCGHIHILSHNLQIKFETFQEIFYVASVSPKLRKTQTVKCDTQKKDQRRVKVSCRKM